MARYVACAELFGEDCKEEVVAKVASALQTAYVTDATQQLVECLTAQATSKVAIRKLCMDQLKVLNKALESPPIGNASEPIACLRATLAERTRKALNLK